MTGGSELINAEDRKTICRTAPNTAYRGGGGAAGSAALAIISISQ